MSSSTGSGTASDPSAGGSSRPAASVRLRDLHRTFGATKALDGLSLDIAPGELVAFLGPSGCGKTTALRVVAGFETVDSGQVLVDGRPVNRIPAQKRNMGMVFQSYSLFPNMNARDNVSFGLRVRGGFRRRDAADTERVRSLLEMVGLAEHASKFPHQLSGGQQQRVALARALAIEPQVLLLDEPLSALDAKVRLQLREQIRLLQSRLGITAIFVTHDQEEALSIADRVCVMRGGRIEQVDVPSEIYARPATPFVAEFVGTMNRIPGLIHAGGVSVLGSIRPARLVDGRSNGTRVDVLARPEQLQLAAAPHGSAILMTKTFLGSVTRVAVMLDGGVEVEIDQPSSVAASMELGAPVEVTLDESEVMVTDPVRAGDSPSAVADPVDAPNP